MTLLGALSIHPRNWGSIKYMKRNTSRAKNKDGVRAKIARMEEHLDRHPADGATRGHLAKKRALL